MREILFCDGWKFAKSGLVDDRCPEEKFYPVAIPHDWLIYQPKDLYENSIGWYERKISIDELKSKYGLKAGEQVLLHFDGVYMNSTVYFNGKEICSWPYGYSAFDVELTDFLEDDNTILVKVVHQSPNSRWYSGAGIYRDVTLRVLPETYLVPDGIYVHTEKIDENDSFKVVSEIEIGGNYFTKANASADTTAEVKNGPEMKTKQDLKTETDLELTISLYKKNTGEEVYSASEIIDKESETQPAYFAEGPHEYSDIYTVKQDFEIQNPTLWDIDSPEEYILKAELILNGTILDSYSTAVGFRVLEFTTDRGLFLNGRHIKIQGVCEHHDLGALGAAFNKDALRRRMLLLKKMGVNAIRTSHNMPAKAFMDMADEMGFLVDSEAFDMWEKEKTPYDYARFFNEHYKKDVRSWIRRDRNYPNLLMWSIGNEIYDTHAGVRGQEITGWLMEAVRTYDPYSNAPVTIGSNFMPWENAQKCADIVKFAGYNYGEKCYEEHHEKHPDWYIYGSETSSIVQSRGVYHFPLKQMILSEDDEQCSALGNSITSWGAKSMEKCISYDRELDFSMGQFIWTGFDYIGEPTPYHTRNSYFGQIDTAGFPKDSYYVYQAEWTVGSGNAMVHVFPYWNFNKGQLIDVRVVSNQSKVELLLNGKSLGLKKLDHKKYNPQEGKSFIADFTVPYEDGEIKAIAYNDNDEPVVSESRHSFGDAVKIDALQDKIEIPADGRSLCFIEISVKDKDGYAVENAANEIKASVNGPVVIAGMDNGDSTDYDSYKGNVRKLFNGKLLLIIQAGIQTGRAEIRLQGKNLQEKKLYLDVVAAGKVEGTEEPVNIEGTEEPVNIEGTEEPVKIEGIEDPVNIEKYMPQSEKSELSDEIALREIKLSSSAGQLLNAEVKETFVTATLLPKDTTCDKVIFSVVNDAGIEVKNAVITEVSEDEKARSFKDECFDDGYNSRLIRVSAIGDGDFRIRATGYDDSGRVTTISTLECKAEGLGSAYIDPYTMVIGGMYAETIGEIGNGNEKGFATARGEESGVVFRGIDFGSTGADEIILPIFALTGDKYNFEIYEGRPGEKEDGLLLKAVYEKPSIWNTYQEERYVLGRKLKGITDISFVFHDKVHMKGFMFVKRERAYEKIMARDADRIYGDSFVLGDDIVSDIGNNVTLEFSDMDFTNGGCKTIKITGYTPLETNTIQICFTLPDGSERKELVEFKGMDGLQEQEFKLEGVQGKCKVSFVFLPGCKFDFKDFRFEK